MSFIYVVGFGDTGRIKVGYSAARPERRVEAHKRGARAYLACDSFAEWVSPDHEEGAANERALIAWCRERSQTQVGEYFTLPYDEVLAYAQSLPMTAPEVPTSAPEGYIASMARQNMELGHSHAALLALKGLLGEECVHFLEFGLHPDYALPVGPILTGEVDQDDVARVRKEQEGMGLGMSYLEIMAGVVINRIRVAVIERRCQAIEAGRLDLASQDYLFTEATA